jgi:predicted 3-demethylubiquinone-9 3-methyltransferase (glyoxalase superfamily)
MPAKQKITTFLWFDGNAEDAARHHTSIFENSKVLEVIPYGETGPGPKGTPMIVRFQLEGQEFIGLNGGPQFKFTEAISLAVTCDTQEEVDELWARLSAGGEEGQCGWLKDKFGLSWQIVPAALPELVRDPDPERSSRVMQAMMQMKKIDIARLRQAHSREGASS